MGRGILRQAQESPRLYQNIKKMKKTLNHTVIPWFLLAASLVLGYLCAFVTEFNLMFSVALGLVFVLAIVYRNNFGKPIVAIARTLLGILFIFSGFVKGVDPLGTQYQIFDYFAAYGTEWANPFAKLVAIGLITAEMIVGIALLLNLRIPFTVWITVLMMTFFTVTTLIDATIFSHKISDCGCFGKAITLTNWQTFYKNIVLNIWVVVLFFGRYRIRNTFSLANEAIIVAVTTIIFVGFQFYNLYNLPVIDFLDWKKGARLQPKPEDRLPITIVLKYKNKETQEIHEFDLSNLPKDFENWEFVDRAVVDPNFNIMISVSTSNDETAQEMADFIATHPDYFFLAVIYDLDKANVRNTRRIFALKDFARENGHEFAFLFDLNATYESIEKFKQRVGRSDFDIYFSDDKSLKAIIRSNPGLILLHDGVIKDKWAWRNVPTVERIQKITQQN